MPDPVTAGDDPLWYKDAIIYQLHVKAFFDANDDGIGDFRGLISRLDYIADLGATAIWLLPFYPSPRRDDGYDISLYEGVSPDYGTMDEARRFIEAAHARGLRVITELVINHTSDQHPWFQAARRAPRGSAERNLYVWADDDKGYAGTPIIFLDTEKSNWTFDPVAGQYYWHRFYAHQPDLNFDNPEVLERVLSVMRFWLDLGVDGLRLDAVPYLVEREGTDNANLPETHAVLRRIRAHLDAHYTGRMLLAEANLWPEDTQQYFGVVEEERFAECHMAFHFPLMPRMYMAIAKEDRFPITDILRQTPAIPEDCQWAIFLRNHDELTLETVTDAERDYLWTVYAADRRARINLGIRRRLAPLLERDRRRIELMNALLLTLPGTPVIYYGDEIGMGDNIHLGDRDGVRTPMQWSPDRNGGFSRADPERLVLPAIQDPLYGFSAVNVEAQSRDAHSLLNWTRRMLAVRRQHPAFGRGSFRLLFPGNRRILAYLREHEGQSILCVANLAHTMEAVELDLAGYERRVPVDLVGGRAFPPLGRSPYVLTLPPYAFFTFRLSAQAPEPDWHVAPPEALPEFITLVVRDGLTGALSDRHRASLEAEALPQYLARRRWFAPGETAAGNIRIAWAMRLPGTTREVALAEIAADIAGRDERYLLPLCIAWEDEPPPAVAAQLALARVRQGRRVGYLTDGATLGGLPHGVVRALRQGDPIPLPDGGALRFATTPQLDGVDVARDTASEFVDAEKPATSMVVAEAVQVKLFRHTVFDANDEGEMARHLALHGYAGTPALLGTVTRHDAAGRAATAALVYRYVRNQGNAANWIDNQLRRAVDSALTVPDSVYQRFDDEVSGIMPLLRSIGRRLGELHALLSAPSDDPAFAPRALEATEVAAWTRQAHDAVRAALDARAGLPLESASTAEADAGRTFESLGPALAERISALLHGAIGSPLIRPHGHFTLGAVLVAAGDAVIEAFQAPDGSAPVFDGRTSPWADLATLLGSLDRIVDTAAGDAGAAADLRHDLLSQFRSRAERAVLGSYLEARPAPASERALLDVLLLTAAARAVAKAAAAARPFAEGTSALARLAERMCQRPGPSGTPADAVQ